MFIGLAGGDFGIQGRMLAIDAQSGATLWSFNTVPHPGEFGSATWTGDSWQRGGGATWTSYSLDEQTGELFVPVDNPAPDLNRSLRAGDNLFTCSLLVLDAKSGTPALARPNPQARQPRLRCHRATVLLRLGERRVVAQGEKGGFIYLIDRKSHKVIYRTAVTTILNETAEPTPSGVRVCPGLAGGMEYNSPGYDPKLNTLFSGAVDWCTTLFTDADRSIYRPGKPTSAGVNRGTPAIRMDHIS